MNLFPQSGTQSLLVFALVRRHTHFILFFKATVSSRPSVTHGEDVSTENDEGSETSAQFLRIYHISEITYYEEMSKPLPIAAHISASDSASG